MAREYAGGYPAIAGCESNGDGWAVVQSNLNSVTADGVAEANPVTLVAAGRPVTLLAVIPLRVGVNPATKKRHYRLEVYDGDGVDRQSFGHWRIVGAEGTAGATGYAYRGEVGKRIESGKRGTNGLRVQPRGYADGGHVRFLILFQEG